MSSKSPLFLICVQALVISNFVSVPALDPLSVADDDAALVESVYVLLS